MNHTPSFTTDTPFDRKIKKSVIRDSLVLMNVSLENRIKYKNLKKVELQKRVLTGIKLKLTPEEKAKLIETAQQERDDYEAKNLGGFVKVYPLGTPEEKLYEEFIKYSTKLWEEWTGASNFFKILIYSCFLVFLFFFTQNKSIFFFYRHLINSKFTAQISEETRKNFPRRKKIRTKALPTHSFSPKRAL